VRVSEQTKRAFNIIISYRRRHHIAAELKPLKLAQDEDEDEDEDWDGDGYELDSGHLHMSFAPCHAPCGLFVRQHE